MIDNRLIYNSPNPIIENIILAVSRISLAKYKKNIDFVSNITSKIIKNENIESFIDSFKNFSVIENEGYVFLGYKLAELICNKDIQIPIFIDWLDNILSTNAYLSQAYLYYLNKLLSDEIFPINYVLNLKQYYEYYGLQPEKLLFSQRVDKNSALKILKEWNSNNEYSKIISGEWKRFYEYLFFDNSYYLIKPLIHTKDYNYLVDILELINNFFILDNILSFNEIRYDMDFLQHLLKVLVNRNTDKSLILKFLIINKIQEYATNLYEKFENIDDEINSTISAFFEIINKDSNNCCIYQSWVSFLTKQIIKNKDVDLSLIVIGLIEKQLIALNLINVYKTKLLQTKENSYENLMTLILLENEPNFNKEYYNLLKEYLLDKKQHIYVNLHEVNKAFEPRFYYLSQLFIGKNIDEKEWYELWKLLYEERKESLYPYFYKNTCDAMYRSIFLVITGVSAIQYICNENKAKTSRFLSCIWQAVKEIYLFNSRFYDNLIVEIIFRLVIFSENINQNSIEYLNFIKYNPSVLTQVLTSLKHNNYDFDKIKNDETFLNSVNLYIEKIANKDHISKQYKILCNELLEELNNK